MIRIVLLGRTGNNIFQYALGRVLAEKHKVPLLLDASWFNSEGWSEVSHFLKLPIKARVVRRFSLGARTLYKLTQQHYWEYRGVPVLKEDPFDQSFDPRFLEAPKDCMLFGYFQTPRYFESLGAELREELTRLIATAVSAPVSLEHRLRAPGSVAVHVRRGDYLHHPAFAVCDRAYFHSAMEQMRARVPLARFFVFSDDPDWCRSAFNGPDTEVINSGPAGNNPLHDLHLMSLATHHIISNSTYSWWAAWLAHQDAQHVLMPNRWYAAEISAPIEEKKLPTWKCVDV